MCGRFTREFTWREVHDFLDLKWPSEMDLRPNLDVRPTEQVPVCRVREEGGRELVLMKWGLVPRWSRDPKKGWINARSETAASSPAFREAFARRRCLVPASGFYEWKAGAGRRKTRYSIRLKGEPILCFAGLWEVWGEGADRFESATILTTRPNELIGGVHDRMPVIVPRERFDEWFSGERPDASILDPLPAGRMEMHA